jgi:hypothetical protein
MVAAQCERLCVAQGLLELGSEFVDPHENSEKFVELVFS